MIGVLSDWVPMTADLGPAVARRVESDERRRRSRLHTPILQSRGRRTQRGDGIGRVRTGMEIDRKGLGQDGRSVEQAPFAMQASHDRATVLGELPGRFGRAQDAGAAADLERQGGRDPQRRLRGSGRQGVQQESPQDPARSPSSHKALAAHDSNCNDAGPLHCVSASGKVGLLGAPKEH